MNFSKSLFVFIFAFFIINILNAATTSWTGTSSTAWATSSNWTNGVPTSSLDVIIGDANFTGSFQPTVNKTAAAKSITIGNSTKASTLTINRALSVSGDILIGSNGTIANGAYTLTLTGNWTKNGTYSTSSNSALVVFAGTSQTISASGSTQTFRKLTINSGSTVTANVSFAVSGSSSLFTVGGTFNPSSFQISGTAGLTVNSNGILHIKASTFSGSYSLSGTINISAGSTVEYSASGSQTIDNSITYSTLRISGSGTKSLTGNLPTIQSSNAAYGNIYVDEATLDLSSFTANRGTSKTGGTLSVANGATLKIGGTNTLPANYNSRVFGLTSTVEYSGAAQTVSRQSYGNLTLSSSSGTVTKTMATGAMTLAGNLTLTSGSGTGVSFTAVAALTITGNMSISSGSTFDGSTFTHPISGNLTNNGTLTSTGTISLNGPTTTFSGSGTHTFTNLTITAPDIICSVATLSISGTLSTTGSGTFTHSPSGTLTMSGTTKNISGSGIILNNLTVSGTTTTTSDLTITGNLSISGTLTATGATITMSGTSKTISGAGTKSLGELIVSGSVSTSANFSISADLSVSGSFTATSPSVVTFTATSYLNGTANLYDITLAAQLRLATDAVLGVANTLSITTGSLNVTSTIPNTVNYNGTGTQNVNGISYNNLLLSNGSTKTAAAAVTVNGDLSIASSTTFAASTFTHTINGNWVNTGTFTPGSSTIQFLGATNSTISGATTFNILTINKSNATTSVTLLNNISVPTLTMTRGFMSTGTNTITITTTRTGAGIIYGNIQRTHAFTGGTAYDFEGQATTITLSGTNSVTSITVSVKQGSIADFPFNGSVSRVYTIAVTGSMGTSTAALKLHYEDNELNGNAESSIQLWHYNGSAWTVSGKTSNSTTSNFVSLSGITSLTNRWTFSDDANVVRWNGSSSSAWTTAANWTVLQGSASTPPAAGDIVELGTITFTNQPTISTSVNVKNIVFGSAQAVTLTVASGGAVTSGGINGTWTGNATHTLAVGAQTLTVNGDLVLSDDTTSHAINLTLSTGTVNVTGALTESGGANITFSGAGNLNIGSDFNYTNGTFIASTGTVTYNGTQTQILGDVTYNNLIINKATGTASKNGTAAINGSLTLTSGKLDINAATTIGGSISIASGTTLNGDGVTTKVGGDWSNSGTFVSSSGTIEFNGTGSQSVSASTFNNVTINKASGTLTLTGNIIVNGTTAIQSGTMDMSTFTANRSSLGGTFSITNGASLLLAGTNTFPNNFSTYSLGSSSNVTYNGTGTQTIAGVTYGNLTLSGGTTNAKTLGASASVNGNITINSDATLASSSYTITLAGNWINNGTFTPATGTVVFTGTSKTISGVTTFNKMTISGSYTVNDVDITINGKFFVTSTGSYAAGAGEHTVKGDLTNSGILTSTGTTTFTGTATQTIQLLNAITSNSAGIINFNGTVSPVLNSTSMPTYATVNINNTGGVTASVGWKVLVAMNIGTGAKFNGGGFTDTISGAFTNNGTVTNSGILHFNPSLFPVTLALGTTLSSTGVLRLGGTAAITITGTPATINDVIISNSNAAGISPPSGWTIGGSLTIRSNAIFNAGSFSYTVAGDIESSGTLNGGTSTFTMSSASGELTGSGLTTFNNFIITGNLTALSDFNVSGNFTNNGTYDGSAGTLIMTGTGASVISASTTPSTIAQIQNLKTNATTTLAVNITGVAALDITSGTFNSSTFSITQNAGTLSINDNSTLQIGGTRSLPTFDTYEIDTLSTIEYNGTGTQAISSASPYGNLTLSGTSTKTVSAGISVLNNFSLSVGTFTGGSFTHTITGNWSMTGGTFTNTGTTILLNGTANQTLKSTGAFNNLTINKASGSIYDSTDITTNGTLTLTSGNIITNSNKHIIASTGSVSRTSGHIIGNLQKNVATGATSRTFEIGDATGYTPAALTFGSVTVTGNLIATTTSGDHTDISNSLINSSKSVNRTWSFTNSGITFNNYSLTLNFLAGDVDAGATTSNFYIANKSGGTWTTPTIGTRTATSTQASAITTFGDFSIGELNIRQWDGGAGTNNWTDANNWNPNGVPASTEDVSIKIAATVQINSVITINGLSIEHASASTSLLTGGSLIVNGVLSLTSGELQINGQSLTLNGTLASAGTGTIKGAANSSLTIGGNVGGDFGTIRMSASSPNNRVQNFTLNRSGSLGSATIGSNGLEVTSTVTLSNGTLNTGGNLTLISSDLTNTARIAKIESTASISGNVAVQRFIPAGTARRWEFWGSPVSNFTLAQLIDNIYITGSGGSSNGFDGNASGSGSAYTYTESTAGVSSNGWSSPATISTSIATGVGMRVFYRGNRSQGDTLLKSTPPAPQSTVIDYVGSINKGNISLPVSCSNGCGADDGWNLVANVYPSPIDWNASSGWTKTNISPTIYIFNSSSNVYAAWDGAVGTNGGSRYIPIGQSFYVKASGTPTLSLTEDVKVSNLPATQMFKTEALQYMRIKMAKDSLSADEAVIKFSSSASKEYNSMEDAIKLFNATLNISSLSADGSALTINNHPDLTKRDTIKLNVSANQQGNYKLSFSDFNNMPSSLTLFLKDAFTNTTTDITDGSTYNFTITSDSTSEGKERFSLVFVNSSVSVNKVSAIAHVKPLQIYPVPAKDQISISGIDAKGSGVLKVINLLGQVVFSKTVLCDGADTIIPVNISELNEGTYFIEVSNLNSQPFIGKFVKHN